jgi:hypothetical protein
MTDDANRKSPPIGQTPRNTVQALSRRASYDREVINAILDDAYVATISALVGGRCAPSRSITGASATKLFVHGSRHNALFKAVLTDRRPASPWRCWTGW